MPVGTRTRDTIERRQCQYGEEWSDHSRYEERLLEYHYYSRLVKIPLAKGCPSEFCFCGLQIHDVSRSILRRVV
jgi:hypothetical protein